MELVPSMISEACNMKYYWKEKGEKIEWKRCFLVEKKYGSVFLLITLFIIFIIENDK